MNKSDYDKYYKKGGSYVIPVEIFDELFNELERLNNIIDKAINYTTKQMKKYEGYDRDFEIVLSNIVVMLGGDKE